MPQAPTIFDRTDLTYNTYLKVNELLALQECHSQPAHHDEMLFIIIHQSYELWFKLILRELENAMRYMAEGKLLRAHHFLRRVVEIQKLLVNQIHILETMTPIEFLGFRDHINPASGFQSFQFRELEFIAGLKDTSYFEHFRNQDDLAALRARAESPDLWESFHAVLAQRGFDVPEAPVRPDADPEAQARLLGALRLIYQQPEDHMEIYMVAEALVDFDTQLALWRYHHVSVVERIIGFKPGTGGSAGAQYLRGTIGKKCFPWLWAVRGHLGPDGAEGPVYGAPTPGPAAPPSGGGCPFHAG